MFAMTSCGKNEQKMRSLSLRETSRFLLFRKASVQQYVPDVMSQYDHRKNLERETRFKQSLQTGRGSI
jgi:hypothetical protein